MSRHCRWAMAPMAWLCPRHGTERRYTISKMLPVDPAAALAVWLRARRMWRLPSGTGGYSSHPRSRCRRGMHQLRRRDISRKEFLALLANFIDETNGTATRQLRGNHLAPTAFPLLLGLPALLTF